MGLNEGKDNISQLSGNNSYEIDFLLFSQGYAAEATTNFNDFCHGLHRLSLQNARNFPGLQEIYRKYKID